MHVFPAGQVWPPGFTTTEQPPSVPPPTVRVRVRGAGAGVGVGPGVGVGVVIGATVVVVVEFDPWPATTAAPPPIATAAATIPRIPRVPRPDFFAAPLGGSSTE